METRRIKIDVPIISLKSQTQRETPPNLPSIDNGGFIGLICGSRGSSKTSRMVELVLMYDAYKSFDHLIIFSPSVGNDNKYQFLQDKLKCDVEVYHEFTTTIFNELQEKIQNRLIEYNQYLKHKKNYDDLMNHKGDIKKFDDDKLLALLFMDFKKPETPYKHGAPTTLIIFDDLNYCKELYSDKSTGPKDPKKFFILHRHAKTSLLFLCQTFKSGVPKQIRNNLSLLILFANKSISIKKEIADELSSFISVENFIKIWDISTEQPYGFLMVDYDEKDKNKKFRMNWDSYFILDKNEEIKK